MAKERTESAVSGATSVAEAVKRVADAAVDAVKEAKPSLVQDFIFTGNERGAFSIQGKGFSTNGTVKINGHQATTTAWGNEFIAGKVPDGVTSGDATVEVLAGGKVLKGTFRL